MKINFLTMVFSFMLTALSAQESSSHLHDFLLEIQYQKILSNIEQKQLTRFTFNSPKLSLNNQLPRAFFCQREDQNDRINKVALRFRLGTVSYTDYLEGKNNMQSIITK